jgi:hypothetical protein
VKIYAKEHIKEEGYEKMVWNFGYVGINPDTGC